MSGCALCLGAVLAVLTLGAASGCRPATPELPAGIQWVTASDSPLQWGGRDFIRLVTPVRPPTTADGTARIVVVLRLPPGATLETQDGERVLPVGSMAARVELSSPDAIDAELSGRWRVLDVRQFDWTPEGLRCSVKRPAPGGLAGVAWRCGAELDARAGEALVALSRAHALSGSEKLGQINGCTGCHAPARGEDRRPAALVQRSTDAAGLFSLRSLWRDEDPVEQYRPVNTNASDPLMTPVCPGGTAPAAGALCSDGERPRLRLDVAAGLARGDAHVRQVCDARLQLAGFLGDAGRAAHAQALGECAPR